MIETLIAFTIFVNAQRAIPVVPSLPLSRVALDRAEYLCTHPFTHQGFQMVYIARHYYPTSAQGEVLAKNFSDILDTEKAWKASPSHLHVIRDARWSEVGYGSACGVTVLEFD